MLEHNIFNVQLFIGFLTWLYTHPNFQRPHFQFDPVWLIDYVKL